MTSPRTEPYPDPLVGVRAYRSDELLDHILVLEYRVRNAVVFMDNEEILNPGLSQVFDGIRRILEPEVRK